MSLVLLLLYLHQSCHVISSLANTSSNNLLTFLQNCTKSLVNSSDFVLSAESVATATLLSFDGHVTDAKLCVNQLAFSYFCSQPGQTVEDSLSNILSPILDSISGALSRIYMSFDKVFKSVKFLASLLQQILNGWDILKKDGNLVIFF